MSNRPWTWQHAVADSDLPATTRHVLLTIALYMNKFGGGSYPTTKTLAEKTGLSERAVCTHIQVAKEHGFLTIKKHGFGGRNWANNEYAAAFPDDEQGTERDAEPSDEALNVVPRGTEPNDTEALNEVHTTSPVTKPKKSNSPKKSDEKPKETVRGNLETILSAEMAEEVIQHRRRIGKAMTPFAAKRLAAKFAQTANPDESAAAMIEHGWQGFEPAWLQNRRGQADQSKTTRMLESFARAGQQ